MSKESIYQDVEPPEPIDPSVLTDDRENPSLFVFEKTWGHRLLAGISVAMFVVAAVMVAYCIVRLLSAYTLPSDELVSFAHIWFGIGIVLGVIMVVPAAIGVYVAKHPAYANLAIALAVFALALIVIFAIVAIMRDFTMVSLGVTFAFLFYALLFAILPIVYLVAALKIKRS